MPARSILPVVRAMRDPAGTIRVCDAAPPVLRVRIQDGSGLARLYVAAIPGYASSPVDIGLLQGVLQEAGQGQLADVVRRSIDLIDRYFRPDDRFTEFAAI